MIRDLQLDRCGSGTNSKETFKRFCSVHRCERVKRVENLKEYGHTGAVFDVDMIVPKAGGKKSSMSSPNLVRSDRGSNRWCRQGSTCQEIYENIEGTSTVR